ncbi:MULTISPECIES: BA14K family protein [unclassified Bradyrhizobium]|uniref:BA14K family protein n=1 Tax=unclassified Bradyrhizobium TaxID=2631580 RepID=UPI00211E201B|nr:MULTISPECIES: BA14K family protein [unclassified Bradyrhizobium]MDD1535895.1 BA14K family protein [Bradyrhizobium sp. WBOS8]MDD1585430.1 BA14K family protein [Bradyrhizobium sp. WBOS4]UUO48685.1 BA14K family protein [Bradyrhizobium sp. WBOS04]UUO62505.1 BA14K family protein [Bradyrhizobium sp. WBOS08]
MNNLRVLSAAATLALILPMTTPGFAQDRAAGAGGAGVHVGGGGGGAHIGGGGGGARMGGGAAMHGGGGSFAAGAAARSGGDSFAAGAAVRPSGGTSFTGGAARNFAAANGGTWQNRGGSWSGGSHWSGGRHHHHHRRGGFWPGFAAGAAIGGLGSYAYYGSNYGYYSDPYYYDSYYDEPTVAVVPGGGDSSAYCAQRFKSYDPASGTYLGYDGRRHPCP